MALSNHIVNASELKPKHLLTGLELTTQELLRLLELSRQLKKNPESFRHALLNKNLVMIFEKPSFRTRLSFSLAIQSMGGSAIESVSNTRKAEEPRDLIRVLNGYSDFVMVRTHDDRVLDEMASYASIPVINGLSALYHPCQVLADLLTLKECFGSLEGLTVTYIGDGNNILHSLLMLAPPCGVQINYCCPEQNQPNPEILANSGNATSRKMINCFSSPEDAVHSADAVYTDVWTSMGFEEQKSAETFAGFQVNEALMSHAKPEAVFMHCMPMERGKEVSCSLPDAPASVIFQQSENRLHIQKAILLYLSCHDI